jgi:hypothetical protein
MLQLGQNRKSGRREVSSGVPLRPDIVAVMPLVSFWPHSGHSGSRKKRLNCLALKDSRLG